MTGVPPDSRKKKKIMSTTQEAQDLRKDTGDVIGATESAGAKGTADGQKHRLNGSLEEMSGKAEAGLGKMFGNPEQEAKGLGKEAAGDVEKAAGSVEENVSKDTFRDGFKADTEYMKP